MSGGRTTVTFSPGANRAAVRTQRRPPASSVTIASSSRPRYSTMSTLARKAFGPAASPPTTTSSGRMAATTEAPGAKVCRVLPRIFMPSPAASTSRSGPRATTRVGKKFRNPMKSATKTLTGWSWISCGVPAWMRMPSRITTTQSESERASTWSWVT